MKKKEFVNLEEWEEAVREADIYVKEAEKYARGEEPSL